MADPKVRNDIGLLLAITSQLFQSRLGALLSQHDLTYSQFALLSHLRGAAKSTAISDLAAALEINQPGVTKVVQRLTEQGFVSAEVDPQDSRRLISLTPTAGERTDEVTKTLAEDSAAWFGEWSDADLLGFRNRLADLAGWLDANRLA